MQSHVPGFRLTFISLIFNHIAMNKEHRTPIFFFAVYFFIFLFLYTAADKVMDHETFENVLSGSVLIGPTSAYIAWLVPAGEILIGITLLVPKTQKTGVCLSLLLMSIFTIYLIFMVFSGSTLPCHCVALSPV